MDFQKSEFDGFDVIKVIDKKLTNANSVKFREFFKKRIDDGHYKFIIDLGSLKYVDSAGIGAMLIVNRELTEKACNLERDCAMIVCNLADNVKSLFDMLKFDIAVKYFKTLKEAKDFLSQK